MYKRTLSFVTGNKNKLKEVQELLGHIFDIVNIDLELEEIQGDPESITRKKCNEAARLTNKSVLVEDTSLCFNALGDGLYKLLHGFDDKKAYALCTFGLSEGIDKPVHIFQGKVEGSIVPPRGPTNFGWDPCFEPSGFSQTFAEMSAEMKNSISHRSLALQQLKAHFEK
uniref:Inosine triphosphate pyrophosphatase n=1 Tax=Ditylenchus dipsaci TaxID=166011 RepID=A0A915ECV3_9BILA